MGKKNNTNEFAALLDNIKTLSNDDFIEMYEKARNVLNSVQEEDSWSTDIITNTHINCGQIDVSISAMAKLKIDILMDKFTHTEWLAYLIGNINDDVVYIDDIVIPKQEVTTVNVFVDSDNGIGVETIGVIHSHHDMGNEFSHTDDEFINANHDVSLCVTHNRIKGHVRVKISENEYGVKDANIVYDEFIDFKQFMDEIDTSISYRKYRHNVVPSGASSGGVFYNTYTKNQGVHSGIENAEFSEIDEHCRISDCVSNVCSFIDSGMIADDDLKEFCEFLQNVIAGEKDYDEYSSDIYNSIYSDELNFFYFIPLFEEIDNNSGILSDEDERVIRSLIRKIESYIYDFGDQDTHESNTLKDLIDDIIDEIDNDNIDRSELLVINNFLKDIIDYDDMEMCVDKETIDITDDYIYGKDPIVSSHLLIMLFEEVSSYPDSFSKNDVKNLTILSNKIDKYMEE